MTKRLLEPDTLPALFLSLPLELQQLVCDSLHVFDRYRLSRTSRHFQSLMPESDTVDWLTEQRCRPCGSTDFFHKCPSHKQGLYCPVKDRCIVKKKLDVFNECLIYVREMRYTVRLLYNERENSFLFRTAAKFDPYWGLPMGIAEHDLFQLMGDNVLAYAPVVDFLRAQLTYTNWMNHEHGVSSSIFRINQYDGRVNLYLDKTWITTDLFYHDHFLPVLK